jgi:hypothetical protein
MAQTAIQRSQENFMLRGGCFELPMQQLREAGILADGYVYYEYPKMVRISEGTQTIERSTEDCKGRTLTWSETKERFREIVVNSEEEEERVLSGGRTSAQLEEERQHLLQRCRVMGIHADPGWSSVRLRRELGDALDAPAPVDTMAKLEQELAALKKMAAMQAEIDALRAQLGRPVEDTEELRSQLIGLGVKVDGRWSAMRLREELDRATAP